MKALFITRIDPFKKNGGAFATKAYIDAFQQLSSEFTLMLPDNCVVNSQVNNKFRIIPVPPLSKFHRLLFPFTGIAHRFVPFIYKFSKRNSFYEGFDTIILNGGIIAGSMVKYFKKLGKKVITIHHNVEVNYHLDNRSIDSFKGKCLFHVKRFEKTALLNSDVNLSISRSDINELIILYNLEGSTKIHFLGCFEDRDRESSIVMHNQSSNNAIITGSLKDVQTKESIIKFIDNIWPSFREEFPEWNLTIAGRDPDEELKERIKCSGINLIVNPDDMNELIRSQTIYICPTCLGSGLKLRIMDGLRNGLPVITHDISSRGYEDFIGNDFFKTYSSLNQFISGFKQLTRVECKQEDIQKKYTKIFSYKAGVERLKKILEINKII